MENQEKICRLCFTKCTSNFECIEEITKDILDKLLVKINLGISHEPVLCRNCSDIIQRCLDFKSICLSTENYIVPFVNDKGQSKLNLKQIYRIIKNEQVEIPDDHSVCILCMDLIENEQEVIISERVMLEKCLPELDITLTKNPVICSVCHDHLQNYYSFVMNCSTVEEMINKYYGSTVINRQGLIQLKDVIQFTTRNGCGEGDTENKLKEEEENQIEIKHEQFMEMEDQKFNGTLQYSPKTVFGCEEDDYKVDISKFCEKHEIKIKQEEETSVELESPPFLSCGEGEIKMEHHDLDRLQDNDILKCEFCPFQTYLQGNFQRHMLIHEGSSEVKMFKCNFCSYEAKRKKYLQKHLLIHKNPSEIIMFKCNFCSYQTKHKHNLQNHFVIHKDPSEITMFKCNVCSYQTKHNKNLQMHILIHKDPSEITMFKCDFCSYQTKHKHNLQKHILIHKDPSEITMSKCNFCSYQTKYKESLQKHMLIHKDPSEITMFKCNFCSYQAKYKNYLQKHLLAHKDPSEITMFNCNFCSYQTKYRHYLQRHLLIHKSPSEITMFKCESCSYQTKHKSHLQRHMGIHRTSSEITIFKCEFCSYQTKRKRDLQRHMLIHEKSSEIPTMECESGAPEIAVAKSDPY